MSRNGGTMGGGWVHLKGANSMAASGLGFGWHWVGQHCQNGGPTRPEVMPIHAQDRNVALFSVCTGIHWLRAMNINNSLMSGCGLSHESAEDGCKGSWVKFRASKPKRREYGTFKLNSPYQV